MRVTITEKAATAINELNESALVLAQQMKSGELNKPVADKAVLSAQRKVTTWRKVRCRPHVCLRSFAAARGISQLEFAGRTRDG